MRLALSWRILIVAAGLIAALVGLVISESRARASGREVALPMEAVDPRNLLTGHYVALRLTQRLPAGQPCPDSPSAYEAGKWLGLTGQGRFVRTAESRQAALGGDAAQAVRGGVYCARMAFGDREGDAVTLDIGVDRFHADQDEAQRIERALPARRADGSAPSAFAVVSVGADGRARLKGVIVDGRRTDLTWF